MAKGCMLYQHGCRAKILSVMGEAGTGIGIEIDKGADFEIMKGARGRVTQGNASANDIEVLRVNVHSSVVVVSDSSKLDVATLVKTGEARLAPPDACVP